MNNVTGIDSISKKKFEFTAPSNWNEVNEKQLIAWAAICLKKLEFGEAIRMALIVFYSIPPIKFFLIPESQKVELAPTLEFLFGPNKLIRWIIKEVKIASFLAMTRRYYGPEDRLSNITIGEFRRLEFYWQAFTKSYELSAKSYEHRDSAEGFLDLLIATLYRPKRKGLIDKDVREDISEHGLRLRAEQMAKLPRKVRHAILLNYEGCRAYIREKYLDKLPKGESKSESEIFDYNGIILSVSGGKFGTFKETESAPLYEFLQHVVDTAEEVERLKSR
jgi:hypothetical protein